MMNLPLFIAGIVHLLEHLLDGYMGRTVEILQFLLLEPVAVLVGDEHNFVSIAEWIHYILLFNALSAACFAT